jgi:predicted Zn finger-like uncharacterized protein
VRPQNAVGRRASCRELASDERWERRTARARKSGEKNSVEVHYRSTPQTHMKITCQSCQSKYNVADDKVTGKIVKIRCRKCGATIVVDGTTVAETGGNATPSGAPTAGATSQLPAAGEPAPWHVNVSDNDQRTMTLSEVVDAYNAGTITQDTFIWTEGMEDWKPLRDVEAVVGALHDNAAPASIAAQSIHGADAAMASREPVREAEPAPRPAQRSATNEARPVAYASPLDTQAEAPRAEPKRAALKRETRGRDLFGGGDLQTSRANSDTGGVLTSAPLMPQASLTLGDDAANKLTGERNENSVLFSLAMLTKNADERAPAKSAPSTTANNEDSGLIDLKALAAKAESIRPPTMGDGAMFSPPLGSGGVVSAPFGSVGSSLGEAPQKSRLPVLIVIGAAVIALVVLAVFIGVRIGTSNSAASAVPAATATAMPSSSTSPETAASASAAAEASAAAAAASASAAAAASAAPKPKPAAGGTYHAPAQSTPAKPASAPAAGTTPTAAPAVGPKKSDCGCNGDLMCLMKCSTAH